MRLHLFMIIFCVEILNVARAKRRNLCASYSCHRLSISPGQRYPRKYAKLMHIRGKTRDATPSCKNQMLNFKHPLMYDLMQLPAACLYYIVKYCIVK
jgi:hypothetical protein